MSSNLTAFTQNWVAKQQAYADYELKRFEKFLEAEADHD